VHRRRAASEEAREDLAEVPVDGGERSWKRSADVRLIVRIVSWICASDDSRSSFCAESSSSRLLSISNSSSAA
jgi:hypothetical protein